MQPQRLDLTTLKGHPERGWDWMRQWMRDGRAVLALCRGEELDEAFSLVYARAGDNLALIPMAGERPSSLYPGRMEVWRYENSDFIPCSEQDAEREQPEGIWGFLLFATGGVLLPVGLFSKMLPPGMQVHAHVRYEGRYLFHWMPGWRYAGSRVSVYMGDNGCTASVPALPVIAHLIGQYRAQGGQVELSYAPWCDFYNLYSLLLDQASHRIVELDAKIRPLSQILSDQLEQAAGCRESMDYVWIQTTFSSSYRRCHMTREILAMSGLDDSEDTYESLLKEFRPARGLLSGSLAGELNLRETARGIVAVQFSCFTDWEHAYDTDCVIRRWPAEEIGRFVDGCRRRGLAVVNLSPLKPLPEGMVDCSSLSLGELAGVIERADLVVGIDHFCCQLAGVLGVPNLSVYRGGVHQVPVSPNGGRELCFRPVSRNLCLIEDKNYPGSAGSDALLKLTEEIFDGRQIIRPGLLRYEDTQRGMQICRLRNQED